MNLGEYHIEAKIGQGGMAEVFKATKPGAKGFKKTFALKRILPPLSDKTHFINMLFDEAHLQAKLSHPNLVQVYDFAQHEQQHYLIMEYIEGFSLKALSHSIYHLDRSIPWQASVFIISQVLKALNYIHLKKDGDKNLNIIHRDISPQNILLSKEGQIKLADFGIAWSKLKNEKTKTGIVKGKTAYLSPEQVLGQELTVASDIFSCAIVLYELLCKRTPFIGASDYETMKNIEHRSYPLSKLICSHAPQELHKLIDTILQDSNKAISAQDFQYQLNALQDPTWLSQGDILFSTWLKNNSPSSLFNQLEYIGKTQILTKTQTQTQTQTKQERNQKKRSIYWLIPIFIAIACFTFFNRQSYFQNTTQKQIESVVKNNERGSTLTSESKKTPPLKTQAKPTLNRQPNIKIDSNKNSQKILSSLKFIGPDGSKIYVNGQYKMTLPEKILKLEPNTYLIQWTLKSGQNKIKRIKLKPDSSTILLWHSF